MSIGSGSPLGDVGSAGVPGMSGGASGIAGTSGTDSGITYSAYIAPQDVPGGPSAKRPGAGVATQPKLGRVVRAVHPVFSAPL